VVTYLVSTQSGVQGVYSASGSSVEQLSYSLYGVPTITAGTAVTPFGFQGSYSDPTGLLYLINRYYDPSTDQFVSIDPLLDQTGQPYVFTNDSPLNATDPLGQCWFACGVWHDITKAVDKAVKTVQKNALGVASLMLDTAAFAAEAVGAGEVGAVLGAVGAAVGYIGCHKDGGLACVGITVGAVAFVAGTVETTAGAAGFEATAMLARGAAINFGAASVTLDTASLVVSVSSHKKEKKNRR